MNEASINIELPMVTHDPTVVMFLPTDGMLDMPSVSITHESWSMLEGWPKPLFGIRADQKRGAIEQMRARWMAFIALVGDHTQRPHSRKAWSSTWNGVSIEGGHAFFRKPGIVRVALRMKKLAVDRHHLLWALVGSGFADCVARFWVGARLTFRKPTSESKRRRSSDSDRENPQMCCQTRFWRQRKRPIQ